MAQPIHPSKTALTLSVIFGTAGILLALAITGALFSAPFLFAQLGQLCLDAYGYLAYWLPVYLFVAALILSDTYYRPDRIFALTASIVPFFTLTLGLYVFHHYEDLLLLYPLLGLLGTLGIGLLLLLVLLAEVFLILLITKIIAQRSANPDPKYKQTVKVKTREKQSTATPLLLIEQPLTHKRDKETYPLLEDLEAATEPVDPVIFELPEVKPLASAKIFEELHEKELHGRDQKADSKITLEADSPEHEQQTVEETDQDLEQALTEAEALAEKIAREKAAERAEVSAELAKEKPVATARKAFSISNYHVPVEGLLTAYPDGQYWIIDQATRDAALILKETLKEFNIQAEVTGIRKGPVITMFEILPAPGVKLSKIVNLQDNIALRLAASSVRIVAPIPGKHAVGIEVPNHKRNIVSFREMIEGELHREGKKMEIPVILGKDITGEAQTIDLVQTPHLLIAGATGSGKSVCVNSMILSILYQRSPAEVRLMLIDPKIVELKLYNDIPHLLTPVITEPKRAFQALQYCIYEMERRYALLDSMGVRDIRSYNKRIKERNIATERLPYIVVVIDEFADLMATTGKELESTVARLAAMSRAVGIHLVLATQRPSIDVITGLIKANIPSRIAFMVASKMDSRIIIDMVGAEKLLGKGDMLYAGAVDPFPVRMQGAFVSEEEVEKVVEYVKGLGEPDYLDDEIFYDEEEEEAEPSLFDEGDDPLYEKALEIVYQQGKASASYIQRRLKIGYNRAARIVELMEERGIVGPAQGSKPRELLRGQ
ncbi:MAG: DNA translocase FtsK [Treponema sp.]|nr:DNA translocase FtsK [Treponema sp.]